MRRFIYGFQKMAGRLLAKGFKCRKVYDDARLVMRAKPTADSAIWLHFSWGNLNSRSFQFTPLEVSYDHDRIAEATQLGGVPLTLARGVLRPASMWMVFNGLKEF